MATNRDQLLADRHHEGTLLRLRANGVTVVIDARGQWLPRIIYWGSDLGPLTEEDLIQLDIGYTSARGSGVPDQGIRLGILPEHAQGWPGEPGLKGHRAGRAWSPLFTVTDVAFEDDDEGTQRLRIDAQDRAADLGFRLEIELLATGVLRLRSIVRNEGNTSYTLDGLILALPVPPWATELLDLTGRHLRERSPQRHTFDVGARVRDSWRGRTGLDATLLLMAGTPGFGFRSGEVWGIHVAWSGNHRTYAERLASGERVLAGGELLLPGEVRLETGEEYASPWIWATYGAGLDAMSSRLHAALRARSNHPHTARPVVLNTWEAVYFDHDFGRLAALAEAAAQIGVERFVLDDGWFVGRRHDRAGLGDWFVNEDVWPGGLSDLVGHVRRLGMQFGLWVEPEMISPDSNLARAHPNWIMATGNRYPPQWRYQQVLDLTHEEAFSYILDRLDRLVTEYDINYLKWDHNRDLIDGGHFSTGNPAVHEQTLAVYALLDELRRRHPALEIESCSSGGGRVDLAILQRTERVWTSDCNDALERQSINEWTSLLLPLELMGTHVGPEHSHTTGREHGLDFRAGVALFGHFGIEMDVTRVSREGRARLREWVELYKRLRPLLHTGQLVRADHPNPALRVNGVVARDRSEAVYEVMAVATSLSAPPGLVTLPGLDPLQHYRVELLPPGDVVRGINHTLPPWLAKGGVTLPGVALGNVGLQAPDLFPETLILLHAAALRGEAE